MQFRTVAAMVAVALGAYAGVTVQPIPATKPAATAPATTKAAIPQDGPGLYRISAGPKLEHTATVRAKSREHALEIAMKTVAKKAMDYDENVSISRIHVERIGP